MGFAVSKRIVLEEETCIVCGTVFAMPDYLMATRRENGQGFFCPNGHSMTYGKGEIGRLRQKLDEQVKATTRLAEDVRIITAENQRIRNEKDKVQKELKRVSKRASAGVCPCCNRTFQHLARHMQTKRKDFKP